MQSDTTVVFIVAVFFKKDNEKNRNGIWVIHLYNHHLTDALDKIQERACYITYTLRTSYVCS